MKFRNSSENQTENMVSTKHNLTCQEHNVLIYNLTTIQNYVFQSQLVDGRGQCARFRNNLNKKVRDWVIRIIMEFREWVEVFCRGCQNKSQALLVVLGSKRASGFNAKVNYPSNISSIYLTYRERYEMDRHRIHSRNICAHGHTSHMNR